MVSPMLKFLVGLPAASKNVMLPGVRPDMVVVVVGVGWGICCAVTSAAFCITVPSATLAFTLTFNFTVTDAPAASVAMVH